jgi:PPK2 family polyphosphate:nucleotide phosphotransferase
MHDALAVRPGRVVLAGYDSAATPLARRGGGFGDVGNDRARLADLQQRLYAEAGAGSARRVLLVLQGKDTSGKGGVTNHVVSAFQPIGVQYTSFKKPTAGEAAHDFLWRVRPRVPDAGVIGVFDRSHYEDVLVPRVHGQIDSAELNRRYAAIDTFEAELAAAGTTIVKCFLHISYDVQRERLLARLDDPAKQWKLTESDLDERVLWSSYLTAYEAVLERCNPPHAPWYVVPSDSKKYRNWAVAELLRETLEQLDPQYPKPTWDRAEMQRRLTPPN